MGWLEIVCNDFGELVLTAGVPVISGLPTGITLGNIVWTVTNGGEGTAGTTSVVEGVKQSTYTLTKAGTYKATLGYTVDATLAAVSKLTKATGEKSEIVNVLDALTAPTISLEEEEE